MEGHEPVALLLLVVHLVPAGDGDLVHLNGAARLRGHQDLSRHNLKREIFLENVDKQEELFKR